MPRSPDSYQCHQWQCFGFDPRASALIRGKHLVAFLDPGDDTRFWRSLSSSRRRRPRLQNFRLGRPRATAINHIRLAFVAQLACGKEYGGCPGWEKVESGDKLRGKGWQKGPVPSQQLDQDSADCDVERGIKR